VHHVGNQAVLAGQWLAVGACMNSRGRHRQEGGCERICVLCHVKTPVVGMLVVGACRNITPGSNEGVVVSVCANVMGARFRNQVVLAGQWLAVGACRNSTQQAQML
jgi:hypothetical protein